VWIGLVLCIFLCGVLLVDVSEVWAQSGAASTVVETPSFSTVMTKMIPMFGIVFAIFYLLVISPQKKEIEDQKRLLASLKKGDSVVTSGGLLGRVTAIGDDYVTISLEQNAAVRVERHHIAKKL
jgi:preprotein translocase subunit YajC